MISRSAAIFSMQRKWLQSGLNAISVKRFGDVVTSVSRLNSCKSTFLELVGRVITYICCSSTL